MSTHTVKSWPWFFQAMKAGAKKHDMRPMDRDWKIGDTVVLQEFDPRSGEYTGNEHVMEITYITSRNTPCALSSVALDKDHVILSLV